MATIINILYLRNYDIALIIDDGIAYYKEKGFYGLDGLKK